MKRHEIYQYDESGAGRFEPSWYASVWCNETTLKMQVKGLPFNSYISLDARAIPQLISALKNIQEERKNDGI